MPAETTNNQTTHYALSMWQPWASLLAYGIKKVETRGNRTSFRGEFYIHATGTMPRDVVYNQHYLKDPEFLAYVNDFLGVRHYNPILWRDFSEAFPKGQLIGKALLGDCMPSWELKKEWGDRRLDDWERESTLGIMGPDRHVWTVHRPMVLDFWPTRPEPHGAMSTRTVQGIPAKGNQSHFWKIPPAVLEAQHCFRQP